MPALRQAIQACPQPLRADARRPALGRVCRCDPTEHSTLVLRQRPVRAPPACRTPARPCSAVVARRRASPGGDGHGPGARWRHWRAPGPQAGAGNQHAKNLRAAKQARRDAMAIERGTVPIPPSERKQGPGFWLPGVGNDAPLPMSRGGRCTARAGRGRRPPAPSASAARPCSRWERCSAAALGAAKPVPSAQVVVMPDTAGPTHGSTS